MTKAVLADFQIHRPRHEMGQKETLEWMVAAHTQAEEKKRGKWSAEEKEGFLSALQEKLWHVACKPDKIHQRGHSLDDFLHTDWEKMVVYPLHENPEGADLRVRLQKYEEVTDSVFHHYYEKENSPPDHLIHVTCTGYVAPSSAQKIVARKNWGDITTVTHAYHMGCYGAIPAVRMAEGFAEERCDIVHTEVCSLHTNPSLHTADQLVAQSLFADGFIKYSRFKEKRPKSLTVLSTHEKIIPFSEKAMTWNLADWGFQISLAKEIPVLIARSLHDYLTHLCKKGGKDKEEVLQKAHFAIHPGGPKILQNIQEFFQLRDEQVGKSGAILARYGNMSSATLPHIWESILADNAVPEGALIVSLAFGPGLTICGALLEKN